MTALERLAARLGSVEPVQLGALLEDAEGMILACTGRSVLPAALETAKVQLAVILYNRQGVEGQTAHGEGGVSRAMEGMPEEIRRQIAPYRIARVMRNHEASGA